MIDRNRRGRVSVLGSAVILFATFHTASADLNIGSSDSGSGSVTTSLAALVDLTITDTTIAFGANITVNAGEDTFDDSRGANTGTSDSINTSNVNSNVNVGAYFRRDGLTTTAYAVGTNNTATLSGLDYATTLSATPKAGQYYDGTNYWVWSSSNADLPGLWIFFDDGYDDGAANVHNNFSQPDGTASAFNSGNFTPYIIQLNASSHRNGVPDSDAEMPTSVRWTDNSAVTTSDTAYEGVVVYYNESAGPSGGREGSLQTRFVQIIAKAGNDEIMCRNSTASAGGNWAATSGWDQARGYSGALNTSSRAPDTTCTILGNRYTPSFTNSNTVVLSLSSQLRLNVGGSTTATWFAALAFPKEAPRLDYSWAPTLNAVNWAPIDALGNTADDKQYP